MNAKTLFAALAATSMLTVFGDYTNAVNFEGYTEGATLTNGNNDNGTDTGVNNAYFLYQGDEDNSVVTNTLGSYTSENGVPKDGLQTKSLYVDTRSGTLFRSVTSLNDASTLGSGETFSDKKLFVDTLVQFTITEEDEEPTTDASDKLAIWLNSASNLCVKAGYAKLVNGIVEVDQTNYTLNAASPIEPGVWYRLTVETMGQIIDGDSYPGFKIYLDGNPMTATAPTATEDFTDMQGVFPSLVSDRTLVAVGFKGTGAVDDLVITDGRPNFLPPETIDFTLTWDANVTSLNYYIGEELVSDPEWFTSGVAGSHELSVAPDAQISIFFAEVEGFEPVVASGTQAWTNSNEISATLLDGSYYTYEFTSGGGTIALIYEGGSSGDEDWVPDSSTIAEGTSAADQYHSLADSALATADAKKLTDWATNNNIDFDNIKNDTTGDYVDAYLLNCTLAEVDDEKEEFKGNINISFDEDGKPVITLREGSENQYNGTLKTMGATVLSNDPDDWTEVDGDAEDYTFFKFELSL